MYNRNVKYKVRPKGSDWFIIAGVFDIANLKFQDVNHYIGEGISA
jgi:hypothetical protein